MLWLFLFLLTLSPVVAHGDSGYRLWLKYDKIKDADYLNRAREAVSSFLVCGNSATVDAAREELRKGLEGLLGTPMPPGRSEAPARGLLLAGTPASSNRISKKLSSKERSLLGEEGYVIREVKGPAGPFMMIAANADLGVLYGIFHFLRLLQTQASLSDLDITSRPRVAWRMLNHWDNLDGTVERGYAGGSLWKWDALPGKIDPRYKDYARANASIGINGLVLNNVNANPLILREDYLKKAAALAAVFRPYGIHVFLSANFAAPKRLGGLPTADPLDPEVIAWWRRKTTEIYRLIPDFGGFLVKANSEGQPGPQDYHRTHAQGANMLADALAPHGGVLIWRAFVYAMEKGADRAKMAYAEFKDFDGQFQANVFLQIKNGPLDFQPREPFSPLFGAMPNTNAMPEFQITQEYLGHDKALVYLAPLFKETLTSDTYGKGKGSTVARVMDGSLQGQKLTGIAGVANIGSDSNWTGYLFGQANWYAFGRLAWNYKLTAEAVAREWITMTLTDEKKAVNTILTIMLSSREALVNYQTPLGLNVLCGYDHYQPDPAVRQYYHRADTLGLGFDRTESGSDAVGQYFPAVRDSFNNIHSCPEKYLAWFHHVPWDFPMESGRSFREELTYKYNQGVKAVGRMRGLWGTVSEAIDPEVYRQVAEHLSRQQAEARKWRQVCLDYFKRFSRDR